MRYLFAFLLLVCGLFILDGYFNGPPIEGLMEFIVPFIGFLFLIASAVLVWGDFNDDDDEEENENRYISLSDIGTGQKITVLSVDEVQIPDDDSGEDGKTKTDFFHFIKMGDNQYYILLKSAKTEPGDYLKDGKTLKRITIG